MSTLDTAKRQLETALARLETCFAAIDSAAASPTEHGDAPPESGLSQALVSLRADNEHLAGDLAKSRSERETQKQINRSVADALDIAISRLDSILAE